MGYSTKSKRTLTFDLFQFLRASGLVLSVVPEMCDSSRNIPFLPNSKCKGENVKLSFKTWKEETNQIYTDFLESDVAYWCCDKLLPPRLK